MAPWKRGLMRRLLRQRGFTLIVTAVLLSTGVSAMLVSTYRPVMLARESDQKTTTVLALAKSALIGYALRGGDCAAATARRNQTACRKIRNAPGSFPVPIPTMMATATARVLREGWAEFRGKRWAFPNPKTAPAKRCGTRSPERFVPITAGA